MRKSGKSIWGDDSMSLMHGDHKDHKYIAKYVNSNGRTIYVYDDDWDKPAGPEGIIEPNVDEVKINWDLPLETLEWLIYDVPKYLKEKGKRQLKRMFDYDYSDQAELYKYLKDKEVKMAIERLTSEVEKQLKK